jgi:anti-sigma regulatory factor (Ser/Thr protein kinase)
MSTALKSTRIPVVDSSQIGEARRAASVLAAEASLDSEMAGRLALVVSEAAANIALHGGAVGREARETGGWGEVILRRLAYADRTGVEMLALDRGRGIDDVPRAMRDGYSTGGTRGGGLGAIERLSSRFDILSATGFGTILLSQICNPGARPPSVEVGAVCLPMPGQTANGDSWSTYSTADGLMRVLVADGLGHGSAADEASETATRVFAQAVGTSLTESLERIHAALRTTRGAAIAGAFIDPAGCRIEFGGIGNVAGTIVSDSGTRSMVSHNGTAGHSARKVGTFTYDWPANGVMVMHTDGLASHWKLDRFPGLARRHPSLIAAQLYRDCARGRDDVTIVACRRAPELTQ